MPCYNAAATLEEALASLAAQTLAGFELIAVDDGSTDDTPELLQAWAGRDARLELLHQPHGGIIAALNTGLAHCRAPLVARMDSDDRCHPQRLAQQVDFLACHPEIGLVSCRVEAFPAADVRTGFQIYLDWLNALLTDAEIRREIFVESPLPHPSVTFRRTLVEQAGGYQEHGWPEDYDLWLRLYLHGARFARLPEVLLSWRERPDRLTRCDSRYSLENFLRAKACYLARGPLAGRETVFIWGAGMMGRRLARQLEHQAVPVKAFFDVDPLKIGRTRRGRPVLAPSDFPRQWRQASTPALLAAVGARGARPLIRQRLQAFDLVEGQDWWFAA
jgi:cellulose synthase/poly-beta-1,6-N-acetylglucosamine synthase-like glycosyltransferase